MDLSTIVFAYQTFLNELREVFRCSLAVELDFERQARLYDSRAVTGSHDGARMASDLMGKRLPCGILSGRHVECAIE